MQYCWVSGNKNKWVFFVENKLFLNKVMLTQPYTEPASEWHINVEGKKFNLTYWNSDFHGENADCLEGRGMGGWEASSFPLIDNTSASWKIWEREKGEGEGGKKKNSKSIHSAQTNSSAQPSPSNRSLHLFHGRDELGRAEHMAPRK